MGYDLHTSEVFVGAPAWSDRLRVGLLPAQAYPAGTGSGASVALAVAAIGTPTGAIVLASVQDPAAAASISSKTNTGFTVTITPLLATTTLAAGTVDILIVG